MLGTQVFDRGPDFDPTTDAIVRVEIARLRSKLRDYYAEEGRADPLRIDIPKGGNMITVAAPRAATPTVGAATPAVELRV